MNVRAIFLLVSIPISVLLGIASGFRWLGDGPDYGTYLSFYEELRIDDRVDSFQFESGFVLLNYISKFTLEISFSTFLSTLTIASLTLKMLIFSRIPKPFYVLVFYLLSWYTLHDYTQIRIAIATSILFLAYTLIVNGKVLSFIFIVLLAAQFHSTAFFSGCIIFMCWTLRRLPIYTSAFITIFATAAIPFGVFKVLPPQFLLFLNSDVDFYLNGYEDEHANIFSGVNALTVALLASIAWSGGLRETSTRIIFLLAVAGLGVSVAFSGIPAFSLRLKEALLVFLPLIAISTRLTERTTLQRICAFSLAGWQIYSLLKNGLLSAN